MSLLQRIEAYCRATRTAPTRFGRDAVNDPRFVQDLREGRRAGRRITARINAFIARRRPR